MEWTDLLTYGGRGKKRKEEKSFLDVPFDLMELSIPRAVYISLYLEDLLLYTITEDTVHRKASERIFFLRVQMTVYFYSLIAFENRFKGGERYA